MVSFIWQHRSSRSRSVAALIRSLPPQSAQTMSTAPRRTAMLYLRLPQVQEMPSRAAMSFSYDSTSYMMTLSVKASSPPAFSFSTRSASSSMARRTCCSSPI